MSYSFGRIKSRVLSQINKDRDIRGKDVGHDESY